jgi:hypothetical protein
LDFPLVAADVPVELAAPVLLSREILDFLQFPETRASSLR